MREPQQGQEESATARDLFGRLERIFQRDDAKRLMGYQSIRELMDKSLEDRIRRELEVELVMGEASWRGYRWLIEGYAYIVLAASLTAAAYCLPAQRELLLLPPLPLAILGSVMLVLQRRAVQLARGRAGSRRGSGA